MATTRQAILSSIANTLAGVTSMVTVSINKSFPLDLDTTPMPCAFVYSSSENRAGEDDTVMGYESFDWIVTIEVFGEDVDMEELLGLIHTAMFFNCTLDGHADYCWRNGVEIYLVEPLRMLQMMSIDYYILYRHTKGVP